MLCCKNLHIIANVVAMCLSALAVTTFIYTAEEGVSKLASEGMVYSHLRRGYSSKDIALVLVAVSWLVVLTCQLSGAAARMHFGGLCSVATGGLLGVAFWAPTRFAVLALLGDDFEWRLVLPAGNGPCVIREVSSAPRMVAQTVWLVTILFALSIWRLEGAPLFGKRGRSPQSAEEQESPAEADPTLPRCIASSPAAPAADEEICEAETPARPRRRAPAVTPPPALRPGACLAGDRSASGKACAGLIQGPQLYPAWAAKLVALLGGLRPAKALACVSRAAAERLARDSAQHAAELRPAVTTALQALAWGEEEEELYRRMSLMDHLLAALGPLVAPDVPWREAAGTVSDLAVHRAMMASLG